MLPSTFETGSVAIFLPSLGGGGAERAMLNLARGFADRKLRVHLVVSSANGPFLDQVPSTVRLVDLGHSNVWRSLPGLLHFLKREKPGTIISALEYPNMIAIWAKHLSGVTSRVVVTVHSITSIYVRQSLHPTMRIVPSLIKRAYPLADHIVAVSKGVANDLVRITGLPESRVTVIHNPIVTPELASQAERRPKHRWLEPDEPPLILTVGSLTSSKNHSALIRAFAEVRHARECHLMILGEGTGRARLMDLIQRMHLQEDVEMPGFEVNPFPYIASASVFVLASRLEGLPSVLVEALACGTPIVSTDCPSGPSEILDGGRYGQLVPVDDTHAMAQAILSTLEAPPDRTALRHRAADFSLERVTSQYLALITDREPPTWG